MSFDAADRLLLDGSSAQRSAEQRRVRRVRYGAAAFCMLALLVTVLGLTRELRRMPEPAVLGVRPGRDRGWLALGLIALGFILLALLAIGSLSFGF
jgi:hypothetical protein